MGQGAEPYRHRGEAMGRAFGFSVLARLPYAFIVVDGRGRVFFMNDVARRVVSEDNELHVRANTLHAGVDVEDADLRNAIAIAARPGASRESAFTSLRITAGRTRRPIVVMPAEVDGDPLLGPQGLAFVILSEEELPHRDLLAAMYRLTPREMDCVSELMAGQSVAGAARALGISIHTARTHLKRAMEKTGTARQADLVRVLLQSNLPHSGPRRR